MSKAPTLTSGHKTQQAIAKVCRVSRSTVGKILSGGPGAERFSESTREKVLTAAKKLGYSPNRAAQAMRRGRSNLIAIVYFNSSVEDGQHAAGFLSQEIREHGYDHVVFDYLWHGSSLDSMLREVIQLRAEGVVLLGLPAGAFTTEHMEMLRASGIPVMAVSVDETLPEVPAVLCDSTPAIADLARHLQSLGHKKILMLLSTGRDCRAQAERARGFRQGLGNCDLLLEQDEETFFRNWPSIQSVEGTVGCIVNLPPQTTESSGYRQSVYSFAKKLFSGSPLPEAIMCANDVGAITIHLAAHEHGISIPENLAVTGYDDDELGAYPIFDLTTARQELQLCCFTAIKCLVGLIKGETMSPMQHTFFPSLVLRGSCGLGKSRSEPVAAETPSAPEAAPCRLEKDVKAHSGGFTLVELLAIMGVVAVLAALLFTGMKTLADSAKSAQCMSNLRTLGTGFSMYAADNNNLFPNSAQGGYWPGRIAEYVPRKSFFCPVENKSNVIRNLHIDQTWNDNQPFVSYGYNNRYLAPDFGSTWSIPRPRDNITYSRMSRMSGIMLLADAGRLHSDRKSGWGFYVMEPPFLNYSMPLPRHRGMANVLWTDGSVSPRKAILETVDGYKYITQRNWDWRLQ